MKIGRYLLFWVMMLFVEAGSNYVLANNPDSVYLLPYVTIQDKGRSGLRFAWSVDGKNWQPVANGQVYLKCDYGSQKYMQTPYLFQRSSGEWGCIWSLNDTVNQFAVTASKDLVNWTPQRYPFLQRAPAFKQPVVQFDRGQQRHVISFLSGNDYFQVATKDFITFGEAIAIPASAYKDDRVAVSFADGVSAGNVCKVSKQVIARLTEAAQAKQFRASQNKETPYSDSVRFATLKPVEATLTLAPQKGKPISDLLMGVFFEDINYAADGGLYAELIQNRDFEYHPIEKFKKDSSWHQRHVWSSEGNVRFSIETTAPLHPNNPHYAVLKSTGAGGVLINEGFDGIALKQDDYYEFSLFAKNSGAAGQTFLVQLVAQNGNVIAQATLRTNGEKWKKYTLSLKANTSEKETRLEIKPQGAGTVMLDVISLFPKNTFRNRKNGLRPDLAEAIAAIRPKFIRFPGGCVAHGDGFENMYRWKNTIGSVETRKPQPNIWRYHQTMGLGYFEYFQFCEDIGAIPLPIVAAGVPCQNSGLLSGVEGQHGGIPLDEMDEYIQDIMDLIEWANGPANSKWGKLRAEAGHPAPFNLKYIGIGNEDLISDVFEERFKMIFDALKQKHPEITVVGTVGPFSEGTDYEYGWKLASRLKVPIVDEHYYENPGWFINNQDYYDNYDRNKPKVYLGEYASRGNALYNALTEALYLTGIERNGDVVHMTSYAPLLAKDKRTQWNPDLIYFNNTEVKPTVNYEVQKLFGNNSGNEYLPTVLKLFNEDDAVRKRIGVSVVRDTSNGTMVVKLVNLLPVKITLKLDVENMKAAGTVSRSILQGAPTARYVPLSVSSLSLDEVKEQTLEPYSLTVLKISKTH